MDDGPGGSAHGFERALDELGAALDQDLYGDIRGDQVVFDDVAHELVVGHRGRGEPHLDLLQPDGEERLEQRELAVGAHGVDEGLVAVPEVDAAPPGRGGQLPGGPCAVGQDEGERRRVLLERHL